MKMIGATDFYDSLHSYGFSQNTMLPGDVSGRVPGKRHHVVRIINTAHKASVKGLHFLNWYRYSYDTAILCHFIKWSLGAPRVNKAVENTLNHWPDTWQRHPVLTQSLQKATFWKELGEQPKRTGKECYEKKMNVHWGWGAHISHWKLQTLAKLYRPEIKSCNPGSQFTFSCV